MQLVPKGIQRKALHLRQTRKDTFVPVPSSAITQDTLCLKGQGKGCVHNFVTLVTVKRAFVVMLEVDVLHMESALDMAVYNFRS